MRDTQLQHQALILMYLVEHHLLSTSAKGYDILFINCGLNKNCIIELNLQCYHPEKSLSVVSFTVLIPHQVNVWITLIKPPSGCGTAEVSKTAY